MIKRPCCPAVSDGIKAASPDATTDSRALTQHDHDGIDCVRSLRTRAAAELADSAAARLPCGRLLIPEIGSVGFGKVQPPASPRWCGQNNLETKKSAGWQQRRAIDVAHRPLKPRQFARPSPQPRGNRRCPSDACGRPGDRLRVGRTESACRSPRRRFVRPGRAGRAVEEAPGVPGRAGAGLRDASPVVSLVELGRAERVERCRSDEGGEVPGRAGVGYDTGAERVVECVMKHEPGVVIE